MKTTQYQFSNEDLIKKRSDQKIAHIVKDFLEDLPEAELPEPDEITAVESPAALTKPEKKRSGEYLIADLMEAIKESKTG